MNATTLAPARKIAKVSASTTDTAAAPIEHEVPKHDWRPLFVAMQAKVPTLLWAVHERLDDKCCAESAFRLSAIAAKMIEQHTLGEDRGSNDNDANNLIYDCLALIASAKSTTGQEPDELSLALLQHADEMLHALMYVMTDTSGADEIAAAHAALATYRGVL